MFTIPNLLTFGRILLVPCFLYASFQGSYVAAFVIFVSAAVTDILDGMIARRLNLHSRIGALLDPLADKTLMICGFLFYTFADGLPVARIPGWLTFAVFIRDFMIIVVAYLLYTRVRVPKLSPSIAGKLSTVTQAVTLSAVIAVNAFMPAHVWLAEGLFRVSLVATLFSGWGYLRRTDAMLA